MLLSKRRWMSTSGRQPQQEVTQLRQPQRKQPQPRHLRRMGARPPQFLDLPQWRELRLHLSQGLPQVWASHLWVLRPLEVGWTAQLAPQSRLVRPPWLGPQSRQPQRHQPQKRGLANLPQPRRRQWRRRYFCRRLWQQPCL